MGAAVKEGLGGMPSGRDEDLSERMPGEHPRKGDMREFRRPARRACHQPHL